MYLFFFFFLYCRIRFSIRNHSSVSCTTQPPFCTAAHITKRITRGINKIPSPPTLPKPRRRRLPGRVRNGRQQIHRLRRRDDAVRVLVDEPEHLFDDLIVGERKKKS